MPAFDPAATAAAYMATLTPAEHALASAYTHGSEWLLLWGWLVGVLVYWLILWAGALTALRRIADPAGLPVLMAIVITFVLLATPILNTLIRTQESQADSFSLRTANEPDGLSKTLVKTIQYRASSPSALEEFLFYDHPSVDHRVRKAMDWKATHPQPGT